MEGRKIKTERECVGSEQVLQEHVVQKLPLNKTIAVFYPNGQTANGIAKPNQPQPNNRIASIYMI